MLFDTLVLTFFAYSILGYIAEVIYCSVGQRKLVNRGFMYGPWLPIYGFGGVAIMLALEPLAHIHILGPILVFLLGMIITSIIEYIGSWLLEKCFSIKLWDYSKKLGNINGRVCLLNSTLFGIGGLAITYLINPYMLDLINRIPQLWHRTIADMIIMVMGIDFALSCNKMLNIKHTLAELREKGKEIEQKYKALIEAGRMELATEYRERLIEDLERSKERAREKTKRLVAQFPTCTSCNEDLRQQLDNLRAWREETRKKLDIAKKELKAKIEG